MFTNSIKINDENISYFQEELGSQQRRVLFFHGFASSKSILFRLTQIPNRSYAFTAMDMPGNGFSKTEKEQSLENYVSIGKYFLDNLVENDITIMGHSLGTIIAVALANHPKVKNVILISAPNPWFVRLDPTNKINLLLPTTIQDAKKTINFIMHNKQGINVEAIANSFIQKVQEKRRIFTPLLAKEVLNPQYNKTKICTLFTLNKKPTTLIYGTCDLVTPLEEGKDLSKRLAWDIHTIKDIGHTPLFEDPKSVNEFIEISL